MGNFNNSLYSNQTIYWAGAANVSDINDVNSSVYWDGEISQADLNVNSSVTWDGISSTGDITVVGDITSGIWSGSAILNVFLDTLNASKLFNLAALNGKITILVANITDILNLVDTHKHYFGNITSEPWIEDGSLNDLSDSNISSLGASKITNEFWLEDGSLSSLSDSNISSLGASKITDEFWIEDGSLSSLSDSNISNLSLTKITGADVNCGSGFVQIFNASNGTIICADAIGTTYTASSGVSLSGNDFSANTTFLDLRYYTQDFSSSIFANFTWIFSTYWNRSQTEGLFVSRTDWTTNDDYPDPCSAGEFVTEIGDTITCSVITSLGEVTVGVWSATAILDAFLDALNASKLFNLAALYNEIQIVVANITDVTNLLDTHLHYFGNITSEPWLEDGSLSSLSDSNISSLSLSKITDADVNCSEGYVSIFNASNGTIICRVDPAFNYTMDISDALLNALGPDASNVFATFSDLISANVSIVSGVEIRNIQGVTMVSGTPVKFVGYNSGLARMDAEFASNSKTENHADCVVFGTLGNNAVGPCVTIGLVTGVDTSMFSNLDELYLNITTGTLTNVKPLNATCIQLVGQVLRSHVSQGVIWVHGAGRCNDVSANITITGNVTASYYFGNATFMFGLPVDTNASTACSGTTTYLDGENNCDDISSVYLGIGDDTNASTACSGTTTYLDGENNCDDISSVYLGIADDTNASTACSGSTTYLDGEDNCDDISTVYVDIAGDSMTGSLNMTNNSIHGINNLTFAVNESFMSIWSNGTCVIITAGDTRLNICA